MGGSNPRAPPWPTHPKILKPGGGALASTGKSALAERAPPAGRSRAFAHLLPTPSTRPRPRTPTHQAQAPTPLPSSWGQGAATCGWGRLQPLPCQGPWGGGRHHRGLWCPLLRLLPAVDAPLLSGRVLGGWRPPLGRAAQGTLHGLHMGGAARRHHHGHGAAHTLQRGRHDLRGQVQVLAQVGNALVGQVPVKVAPGEGLPHQAPRPQGGHGAHDLEVGNSGHVRVQAAGPPVLLGHHHALSEKHLINGPQLVQRHEHAGHHGCGSR